MRRPATRACPADVGGDAEAARVALASDGVGVAAGVAVVADAGAFGAGGVIAAAVAVRIADVAVQQVLLIN